MMQKSQSSIVNYKPLKEVYATVEERKQYADKRKSMYKLHNMILIRIEPHKSCTIQKLYLTLMVQDLTKISCLNANLHRRLKICQNVAIFLCFNNNLASNENNVGEMIHKGKNGDEDGILYLQYTNDDSF